MGVAWMYIVLIFHINICIFFKIPFCSIHPTFPKVAEKKNRAKFKLYQGKLHLNSDAFPRLQDHKDNFVDRTPFTYL